MITRSPHVLSLFGALALAACGPDAADPNVNPTGPRCGNQIVEGAEECDDGNVTPGDGCNAACRIEEGPVAACGDGVIAPSEGCDDGDMDSGDGCSSGCSVEPGFNCSGAPSTCTAQPGGADGTCQSPFTLALAPDANGNLTGSGTGDTTNGTSQVAAAACDGEVSGAGNDHVWTFTLPATKDVLVLMPSTVAFDAIIRLQSAACDAGTEIPQYTGAGGCSDSGAAMESEALGYGQLPAGTYYILVDGVDAAAKGTYEIRVIASDTTCGDGALDLLEFCDDGDTMSNDGCSSKCEVENGYTCTGSPSVCTMGGGGTPVPPAAGDLVINEVLLADTNLSDSNCDGTGNNNADEFIELVNSSNKTLDLTGVTIDDANSLGGTQGPRHTFGPAASGSLTLAPGKAVVVWGGGSPACAGVDNWFIASATSGGLGLNDAGDTITVRTGGASPVTIVAETFGAATDNVSSTRTPDITGPYAAHPLLGMKRFSPGRKLDDSAF